MTNVGNVTFWLFVALRSAKCYVGLGEPSRLDLPPVIVPFAKLELKVLEPAV